MENALLGIHAGLERFERPPPTYQGIAVYCEWETDEAEWQLLKRHFLKPHY